jgi:dUTP pyrophosphatase
MTTCEAVVTRLSVRIHRLDASIALPKYETTGAAGFDLASSVDMTVQPGEVALVPTGLVLAVPEGHFLGVFARSSTPLKRGLMVANGVGIVDSDYCGATDEIKIEVYNFTPRPVTVARGDRLAQGIVMPFVRAEWTDAGVPERAARGGFGSTDAPAVDTGRDRRSIGTEKA